MPLTEALIQNPPVMLDHAMRIIERHVLWFIRDRFKGKTKQLPEHFAAFKKLVRDKGIKLPPEPLDTGNGIQVFGITVDLIGMRPQYAHLTPNVERVHLALDWQGKARGAGGDTAAAWLPEKKVVLIYLSNFETLMRYPSQRFSPEEVTYVLAKIRGDLEHEMRHMVQSILLATKDARQVERKPDYQAHGSDYWTSNIEFDPMIGSAVDEFMNLVNVHRTSGQPLKMRQWIEDFTGARSNRNYMSFEAFSPNPLFKHLRKIDPAKWQKAVRKFVIELQRQMETTYTK